MFFSLTCAYAVEDNQRVDNEILESDSIEGDLLIEDQISSLSDLDHLINLNSEVILDKDYTFDSSRDNHYAEDGRYGITITKNNIVIDGNGHSINALGKTRIFEIRGDNVILKNINFINGNSSNGGAVYFLKSGTVINCNFTNNIADNGGAIYFYSQGTVIDSKFSENTAYSFGGAMYGNGRTNMTNTEFRNNHAFNGGAMLVCEESYLNGINLTDNVADNFGGALYLYIGTTVTIENSIFERNKGVGASYNIYFSENATILPESIIPSLIPKGLADLRNLILQCRVGVLKLNDDFYYNPSTDSEFLNNGVEISKVITIDGQGHTIDGENQVRIFKVTSNNVTLKNINFKNGNSKSDIGGAIVCQNVLKVENCSFENNIGYFGGAIAIEARSSVTVNNSSFINNRATMHGGAIYAYGDLIVDECTFINNNANSYGGAINAKATVSNSKFINNEAKLLGGAIYSLRYGVLSNNIFIGNSGSNGGAVYSQEKSNTIHDSVFENNTAATNGGAIYFNFGGSVTDSEFKANLANNSGGAVYINYDVGVVTNSVFTLNVANNNGGGVFGSGTVSLSNFTGNRARNGGGGVYDDGGQINQLIFINNTANNGGGLYSTSAQLIYLNFINNTAINDGGGLYFSGGRTVEKFSFSGNTAGNRGGAIYFNGQSTVNNVNFTNNSAKNGGAIYNNNVLTVNNTHFKGDHAYSGGAIQISNDLNIFNSNFEDNAATEGTHYVNLIGNVKITLDNVTPTDLNPFKVSTMTIISVSNGTGYGDDSNITVNVISENKPITEGFAVITLNNVNYTTAIIDGVGVINLTNVDHGRYATNITYISYNYTIDTKAVDFYISKKVLSLKVNISNITVGEILKFTVSLKDGENINTGTISTIINNKEYVENVINGTATFEIQNLDANTYDILIVYNGENNYYTPADRTIFSVLKRNVTLEAYIANITHGNALKIITNVTNDNIIINEGFILLTIGNNTFIEYVVNGTATFEIQNMDVGNYVCNITYIGGKNNTDMVKQVRFSVNEKIYSIEVDTDNITYGNMVKIIANVKNNADDIVNGRVLLELEGKIFEKVLEEGLAIFEIPGLNAGIYSAKIAVNTENDFVSLNRNVTFKVNPKEVQINNYIIQNNTYGETLKIKANVTSDDEILNYGVLFVFFDNKSYNASVENGVATIEIPNINVGDYYGELEYDGGINYQKANALINFEVLQKTVDFTMNFTNIDYGDVWRIMFNVTSNSVPVNDGNMTVVFNNESYTAKVENGVATIEVLNLNVGTYDCNVVFFAGNNYKNLSKSISFEVLQKIVNLIESISDIYYGDVLKVNVNVTSDKSIINEGNVTISFNNLSYLAKVENGTAIIEIPNLNAGLYMGNIAFDGGDNYNNPIILTEFNVLKRNLIISASNNAYVINYGGKYSVSIKGVSGGHVSFTLNAKEIASTITDANGIATISLTPKILKTAKSGIKNLVIKFTGNANYNTIIKTVKIRINKEKTKIVAKKKTFKKAKKIKKYTITLKNSKNKPIKKVKVILKIKKKTFKAKTNAKGNAVFKIKKLTKKGTYKAKIIFKGNKYYKNVTKKVKIKVRG